jgi:hypothetical protein
MASERLGRPRPGEKQSYLVPYENTMDDFNEMAVQFGYLALFSPAYQLAPVRRGALWSPVPSKPVMRIY